MKRFYKIINADGWVLSNKEEQSAKLVLGYGGVWTRDHRKAKRFATIKECQREINKMPCGRKTRFLVVSNHEDWKSVYKKAKENGDL